MDELNCSKLSIRCEQSQISFIIHDKVDTSVTLLTDDLPEIIEFLRAKAYSTSNRRVGFRVRLNSLGPEFFERFRVYVDMPDDERIEVTPVDISLTGVLVKTDRDLAETGAHMKVRLELDQASTVLPVTLVRRTGRNVAFQFDNSLKAGQLDPEPALVAIFRSIEMLWLRARIK